MRIRKLLGIGLSMLLVILLLGGCGQGGAKKGEIYTAYFVGEEVWPCNDPEDYTAPADEATVTVNGITYTGAYKSTTSWNVFTPDVFYEYVGHGFSFTINAKDGTLHSLSLSPPKEITCTLDASYFREIADAIADDYISLEDYQVIESRPHSLLNTHDFEYYREINGIKTQDRIIIELDCSGNLNGLVLWQLGAFENVKSVKINEERAKAAIKNKLEEHYAQSGYELVRYEISNDEPFLVKTETNQCAIRYSISPRFKAIGSDDESPDWALPMLVFVDYKKYNWFKP